jgi:hypothetical protein
VSEPPGARATEICPGDDRSMAYASDGSAAIGAGRPEVSHQNLTFDGGGTRRGLATQRRSPSNDCSSSTRRVTADPKESLALF